MTLGIAASQPIGMREQFGTMTKPSHPGGAARVGLMSALMAQHGYTASKRPLDAPRGPLQVFSDRTDWSEITEGLGQPWEIALNTYKPFACGVVIHTDEVVYRPEVTALRARVQPVVDDSIDEATVDLTIRTSDGRELKLFVEHAIGSVENPMSNAQLRAQFAGQSEPILGAEKTARAWTLAMGIAQCNDLREFIAAATFCPLETRQ